MRNLKEGYVFHKNQKFKNSPVKKYIKLIFLVLFKTIYMYDGFRLFQK